jgi:hypothetical protein
MLTELFLALSILTGLEVVPLQNLASGIASGIASPVLLFVIRRGVAACRRQARPLSDVAALVLGRMQEGGNWSRHDDHVEVCDGQVFIRAERYKDGKELMELTIQVGDLDVTPHLLKGEDKLIYAAAHQLYAELLAEEKETARREALAALQGDEAQDEGDTELELTGTYDPRTPYIAPSGGFDPRCGCTDCVRTANTLLQSSTASSTRGAGPTLMKQW